MKLYKERTNPFSACLPILLQMPIFFALFRLLDQTIRTGEPAGCPDRPTTRTEQFGNAELLGAIPISNTLHRAPGGRRRAGGLAVALVLAMTATTFLTQRQLMSKNMPTDALPRPLRPAAEDAALRAPLVFAFGGIAFPIGVLLYWTTSNMWTMGQQFYVIRNNPAPGTPRGRRRQERDATKAASKGAARATVRDADEPR